MVCGAGSSKMNSVSDQQKMDEGNLETRTTKEEEILPDEQAKTNFALSEILTTLNSSESKDHWSSVLLELKNFLSSSSNSGANYKSFFSKGGLRTISKLLRESVSQRNGEWIDRILDILDPLPINSSLLSSCSIGRDIKKFSLIRDLSQAVRFETIFLKWKKIVSSEAKPKGKLSSTSPKKEKLSSSDERNIQPSFMKEESLEQPASTPSTQQQQQQQPLQSSAEVKIVANNDFGRPKKQKKVPDTSPRKIVANSDFGRKKRKRPIPDSTQNVTSSPLTQPTVSSQPTLTLPSQPATQQPPPAVTTTVTTPMECTTPNSPPTSPQEISPKAKDDVIAPSSPPQLPPTAQQPPVAFQPTPAFQPAGPSTSTSLSENQETLDQLPPSPPIKRARSVPPVSGIQLIDEIPESPPRVSLSPPVPSRKRFPDDVVTQQQQSAPLTKRKKKNLSVTWAPHLESIRYIEGRKRPKLFLGEPVTGQSNSKPRQPFGMQTPQSSPTTEAMILNFAKLEWDRVSETWKKNKLDQRPSQQWSQPVPWLVLPVIPPDSQETLIQKARELLIESHPPNPLIHSPHEAPQEGFEPPTRVLYDSFENTEKPGPQTPVFYKDEPHQNQPPQEFNSAPHQPQESTSYRPFQEPQFGPPHFPHQSLPPNEPNVAHLPNFGESGENQMGRNGPPPPHHLPPPSREQSFQQSFQQTRPPFVDDSNPPHDPPPNWRERENEREGGSLRRSHEKKKRDRPPPGGGGRGGEGRKKKKNIPCRFFATNSCTRGDNCLFIHDESRREKR